MELIEALKQLSLEVKSQTANISTSNLNQQRQLGKAGCSATDLADNNEKSCSLRQLEDFDNSIETLLMQLSDLDLPRTVTDHHQQRRSRFCTSNQILNNAPHNYGFNGSLETSQEEDSDCSSSQQSSSTSNEIYISNGQYLTKPLVKCLMRRDLGDITNTVKRIGQTLSIGRDIASLAEKFDSDLRMEDWHNAKSLCDRFSALYSCEPFMRDLPTLRHYDMVCRNLTNRLSNCVTLGDKQGLVDQDDDLVTRSTMEFEDVEETEDVEDIDCELFDEPVQVSMWTNNKLYINNLEPQNTNIARYNQ